MERTSRLVLILPFLILAALAGPTSPAAAGTGVWTSLGPDGGRVTALAVDPLDPDVVYAGTQSSGVFRSADGGETWSFAGRGVGTAFVVDLAVDPVHRGTVYATTSGRGLLKSTDGGGTWVQIWDGARPDSPGELTPISSLVLDPRRPGTVYAGTGAGVYRSTNGGATWRRCGNLSGPIAALALDSAGGWLFAGREGVFKSGDQGATWVVASRGLPSNAMIEALAIAPDSPRTLLAATQTGIYRTLDRGRSWRATGSPTRQATVVVFQSGGRAYAAFRQGSVFRSTDAGATWQRSLSASPDSLFLALAAGPVAVYTGDTNDPANRGLVRSLDGGATWEPSMRGLSALGALAVAVDPSDPRTLYVGGSALFKSTDRGATWKRLALDIPPPVSVTFDILIDPERPARVYVTTNNAAAPFFRSDDGGETWHSPKDGSVPQLLWNLAVDPRAPGALWGAGSGNRVNGLFHSDDGGTTWERIEGLPVSPDFFALDVEVDPRDPNILYFGGAENVGTPPQTEPRLFRSTDGGETWERRDAGLAEGGVRNIALDPDDPSTLYALTSLVYRSTDAGASWNLLPGRGRIFMSIATVPAGPETPAALYAARWEAFGASAVMCSTDQGETWTALRKGLNLYTPLIVEADPADSRRLYVSTAERGLMTYTRE